MRAARQFWAMHGRGIVLIGLVLLMTVCISRAFAARPEPARLALVLSFMAKAKAEDGTIKDTEASIRVVEVFVEGPFLRATTIDGRIIMLPERSVVRVATEGLFGPLAAAKAP